MFDNQEGTESIERAVHGGHCRLWEGGMVETGNEKLENYVDQVIEAISRDDMVKAVELVRGATGVSEKYAIEMVLTLAEGWQDAEERGLLF